MSTKITKRAIPHPTEAPNRKSVESLQVAVNELTGAVGENMQRAVRVCELVESGILALQPNGQLGRNESIDQLGTIDMSDVTGLTAALNARVLKAGDTMTGTLTLAAAYGLRFSGSAGGRFRVLDDSGNPSLQWTNAAETVFSVGRYVATEHQFISGPVVATAGVQTRNSFNVKVYDNNNDTPVELGLGYANGTDRNAYLWNRNNAFLSFGTNNTERVRIQAGGSVDVTGGQLAVVNHNLIVSGGDVYSYRAGGTTGVIFLRSDATRYLLYDGGSYIMPGAPLYVGGLINSDSRNISGVLGGEGYQIVWNTVQAGQGRMEYINNRGGGAGGHTWWDRLNTSAGTGTALALLNANGYFVNGAIQFATGTATVGQLSQHPTFTNYITLMAAAQTGQEYAVLFGTPTTDTNTYISSTTGGQVRIRPSANSTVGEAVFGTSGVTFAQPCTAPNFTATSDKRLKNVLPATPGYYPRVDELQLAEWTWKKDGKPGRGVIAQDVLRVAPAYVSEHPETGMLSVDKAGLALEMAMLALNLHRSCPCCSATKV